MLYMHIDELSVIFCCSFVFIIYGNKKLMIISGDKFNLFLSNSMHIHNLWSVCQLSKCGIKKLALHEDKNKISVLK